MRAFILFVLCAILTAILGVSYGAVQLRGGNSREWLFWGTAWNGIISGALALFARFLSAIPKRFVAFCALASFILIEMAVVHFISIFGSKGPERALWWIAVATYMYLLGVSTIHTFILTMGKIRSFGYRLIFAYPYSIFMTSLFFVFICSPAVAALRFPFSLFPWIVGIVLAALGLWQTLDDKELCDWDTVTLLMEQDHDSKETCSKEPQLLSVPRGKYGQNASPHSLLRVDTSCKQGLRIIQITDPHVGSTMTPERFRKLCKRVASANPDLVLLTGDYFTVEANKEEDALEYGLEPLKSLGEKKVFACLGNHDLEDELVLRRAQRGISSCGGTLLVDESEIVETRIGPVRIIGVNFYFDAKRVGCVFEKKGLMRGNTVQTIVLLHDPKGFVYVPPMNALVLSGHTHGGQIGFFSLGFQHATLLRLFGFLDNGFWEYNTNILQIHRGQGSRSLLSNAVLRTGVPTENVVLNVFPCSPASQFSAAQ